MDLLTKIHKDNIKLTISILSKITNSESREQRIALEQLSDVWDDDRFTYKSAIDHLKSYIHLPFIFQYETARLIERLRNEIEPNRHYFKLCSN